MLVQIQPPRQGVRGKVVGSKSIVDWEDMALNFFQKGWISFNKDIAQWQSSIVTGCRLEVRILLSLPQASQLLVLLYQFVTLARRMTLAGSIPVALTKEESPNVVVRLPNKRIV